jgi:DNA-nicking Smr family endonuclease
MNDPPRRDGRSRFLSREEIELWRKVTADVRPSSARSRRRAAAAADQEASPTASPATKPKAERAALGAAVKPAKKPTPEPPPAPPSDLDHRTRTKLRRGRIEVEARLDLHGLRQSEAQSALTSFLRQAQANGARMAIVVTGKGARSEEGGVLKRMVPMWLHGPGLRDLVVSFGEASRHHGGEGALYVQIRRPGKSRGRPD